VRYRVERVWRCIAPGLALFFALFAYAGTAWAWGSLGHRVASRIAESRLTPAALARVRDLLEPGETLADASLWADRHRRDATGSAPWHYVNVPLTEPRYDARFCGERGCVVSKIADFRRTLADRALPRAERQQALYFLVHLVEDLHQPLHVGDRGDRGGNDLQLRFFERGTNLHRLWDTDILEYGGDTEDGWVATLERLLRDAEPTAAVATREAWATESLQAARVAYRGLAPGMQLARVYYDLALPIVEKHLALAGMRLASLLNGILR
jgi:nuclease S1